MPVDLQAPKIGVVTWIRRLSPRQVACLFPFSLASSAALVAAAVMWQRWMQKPRAGVGFLLVWAGWAGVAALIGWVALRFTRGSLIPRGADPNTWKSYFLALQAGMLGLVVPAYLYVWRTPYEAFDWGGDFLNKQWLLALYWLAVATVVVGPHFMRRVIGGPPQARERGEAAPRPSAGQIAAKVAMAAILAWYVAGPPWHLERLHREIDGHEHVNLGPLQAIDKGYLPYVGPAASQYGPGSQLLTYAIMKARGHFDLLGYREAGASVHLLTAFGIFLAAALFLEGWMVAPLVLLALAYSPLGFFYFLPNGALEGFYGWANGFRYMGAMIFLAGLPVAMRRRGRAAVGLGAALGLFCFLSQENFATAIFGGGMLVALLWLTGTETADTLARGLARAACGFAAVWTPVLIFYAAHRQLGAFLSSYLLFGRSVAHGALNSWWLSPADSPQYRSYLFTGIVLVAVAVFTLCDVRQCRLRFGLCARQTRLLGFVCAGAAAYAVSLFRSDSWHTRNTTVALPFVLLLAVWDLPRWSVAGGRRRWTLRVAIAGAVLWVYPPVGSFAADWYAQIVSAPMSRFAAHAAAPVPVEDPRIPFQRVTRYWSDEPLVCEGSIPVRPFLEELSALREIVGTRKTMVAGFPSVFPALVVFLADLTPAPHFLPREMIFADMRQESLDYLKAHIAEYECFITDDMADPETKAFRAAYPAAEPMERAIDGMPYYILLRP